MFLWDVNGGVLLICYELDWGLWKVIFFWKWNA